MAQEQNNIDEFDKEAFLRALGQHIKQLREKKGVTSAEFGRRAIMERSHVARLEAGRTNPTAVTLKSVCKALDIEFEDLFKGFYF